MKKLFLYIFSILILTQSINAISCKKLCDFGSYEDCQRMMIGEVDCSKDDDVKNKLTPKAQKYLTECNKGNGKSCVLLGTMYEKGNGIKKDYTQAKNLYANACDNKFYLGCSILASMYTEGKLISKDITKAITLYKLACSNNEGHACSNLGRIYSEDKVKEIDIRTAQIFNKKACDLGLAIGCHNYDFLTKQTAVSKPKKRKNLKNAIETISGSLEILNTSNSNGANINTIVNHTILKKSEDLIITIEKKFSLNNSTIAVISESYGGSGTMTSYYIIEIFKDGSTYTSKSFSSTDNTFKVKKTKKDNILIDLGFKNKKHIFAIYTNKNLKLEYKEVTHTKLKNKDCKWLYNTVYTTYVDESISCTERIGFIIGNGAYHGYYALTQNPAFHHKEFEDLLHNSCQARNKVAFKNFSNYVCKHTQTITRQKIHPQSNKNYLYLLPKIKLPTNTRNILNKLSKPISMDLDGPNENSPWGHTYTWIKQDKIISAWSDASQEHKVDYSASIRMIHLKGSKKKKITTLYGAIINKDSYKTVRTKILAYANKVDKKRNSLKVIKWEFYGYKPTIIFRDPNTKLYNVFQFKKGILKKVSQGVYDLSQAG